MKKKKRNRSANSPADEGDWGGGRDDGGREERRRGVKKEEGAVETVWSNCHIPRRWTEEGAKGGHRGRCGLGGSQSSVRDLLGEAGEVGGGGGGGKERKAMVDFFTP